MRILAVIAAMLMLSGCACFGHGGVFVHRIPYGYSCNDGTIQ